MRRSYGYAAAMILVGGWLIGGREGLGGALVGMGVATLVGIAAAWLARNTP